MSAFVSVRVHMLWWFFLIWLVGCLYSYMPFDAISICLICIMVVFIYSYSLHIAFATQLWMDVCRCVRMYECVVWMCACILALAAPPTACTGCSTEKNVLFVWFSTSYNESEADNYDINGFFIDFFSIFSILTKIEFSKCLIFSITI